MREFLETDVPDGWRRVATSGDPQFADSPHYPIAGLLRDLVNLTEGVDIQTIRSRVKTALGTLDPDLASQVTPLLWLLGDSPADPEWSSLEPAQRQRRLVDAVVSLLHRQAEAQPLVVVIEDLHWLDVASRQVIENLIETLIAARILLIVNYRPEFTHGWAGRRLYRQLHIDPLPDGGMRALLDAMLGDDESVEAVKTQVIDRAGGNPFFLEECIKSIEASGLLEGETGRYRASADAAALILPESVHAVIEARVDRLAPGDKQLLQIASVIGIEVPKALIESVCPLESAAFEDGLSRLQQAEFLIPHRVVPDTVYRFKHALTHDVVYGAMLRQARRDLHLAVLDAIEGQQAFRASDQVDMLAFHAQRAEDWARAARYGRQAGMNAAARSANREAVTLYRQALDALQHLPETRERRAAEIDVHVEIRNAFFVLGEVELVTDHLKQAGEIAAAIEDRVRECRVDLLLSGWYWQRGEHLQALERADQATELATGEGDDVLIALCLYRRGLNRHALGQYDGAVQDLEMSIATLEKVGSGDLFAFGGYPSVFCESFLAWSLAEMGRMEDALHVGEAGWARAESLKNAYSQTVMSFGFGAALIRAGDYAKARSILEEGLELNRLTEVPATYPWIVSALGYALVKLGSVDQGLEFAREAVSAEVRPRGPLYAHPYLWLAEALLDQGDKKAAIDAAETGKVIAEAQGEAGHLAWARRLLGDCWFATDPIRAREHLEIAETLAAGSGMEPLAAAVRTSLARMKKLL